jgi:hypothetical protein
VVPRAVLMQFERYANRQRAAYDVSTTTR